MPENAQKILDCLIQLTDVLASVQSTASSVGRGPGGREMSLVITNLQQAGHWLHDAKDILDQAAQAK